MSQSLFYWITYSYDVVGQSMQLIPHGGLNPYFIGLPILIISAIFWSNLVVICLNPYFIGLPILILLYSLKILI